MKKIIRQTLARSGYVVRSLGHRSGVTGVDLIHDARVLIGTNEICTFFDVGANIGQTIEEFRQVFSSARIYSFEPSPATFEKLKSLFGSTPGVHLENLALGDSEGTLAFHVNSEWSVNDSLLKPVFAANGRTVDVPVQTLDAYCERHPIDRIDLLKIDTQGYDLQVLQGARRMLESGRIGLFSVEVMFQRMYEGQSRLQDFAAFAEQVAYTPVGFYDPFYISNRLNHLNVLFQRVGA